MSKEDNPRFLHVKTAASNVPPEIALHQKEWGHIQTQHPEVTISHVEGALSNPISVQTDDRPTKKQRKHPTVFFHGNALDNYEGHPIRVAVKVISNSEALVSTAYYSSDPIPGTTIWKPDDGNDS